MASKTPLALYSGDIKELQSLDTLVPAVIPPHKLLSTLHSDTLAADPVLGDLMHGNVTPAWARLPGNVTATRKFLRQVGTGLISAAPDWDTLQAGDIPALAYEASGAIAAHAALITGVHGLVFTAGKTLTLTESLTLNAVALNGVLYGSSLNAVGSTAVGAEGKIIRAGASPFVPAWTTSTFADTYVQGGLLHAATANTIAALAPGAVGSFLMSNGASAALSYLAAGASGYILVGAGVTTIPVWTASTGTGAPVRAGSPTFTGIPIAPTIALSNLTDGYVPCHINDTSGLANSPIYTTGSYFGNSSNLYIYIYGTSINEGYATNGSDILLINYTGYQGGTTQFRDTQISDGKAGLIAYFQGSSGSAGIRVSNPSGDIDIGHSTTVGGELRLREGTNAGIAYVGFKAPDSGVTAYTMVFPTAQGIAGQPLSISSVAGSVLTMGWASGTSMTNPMSDWGQMIYGGASGSPLALASDTAGKMLTLVSSGGHVIPAWQTPAAGLALGTANGDVQFYSSGTFGNDTAIFTYDSTNHVLSILGSKAGAKNLQLTNISTGTASSSGVQFGNSSGADTFYIGVNSHEFTGAGDYAYIIQKLNAPLIFKITNAEMMRLTSAGLGVGGTPNSFANFGDVTANGTTGGIFDVNVGGVRTATFLATSTYAEIGSITNIPLEFVINGSEVGRFETTGKFSIQSLTASLPVVSDASKNLVSLAYTGATSFRANLGLETTDSPTFAGLTLGTLGGLLFGTAGVISTKAIGSDVQAYNASLAAIAGGTWTGATSITTLGTISTGSWNATAIAWAKVDKSGSNLTDMATRAHSSLTSLDYASAGHTGFQASGNYITALTGDVTATGPDSVAATIANKAVTLAKMADMATASLIGRNTAGTGAPEVITNIATGITIGGQYIYRAGGTDVPVTDGGTGLSSLTQGCIPFGQGTSNFGSDTNLFWDSSNDRFGVRQSSPTSTIHSGGSLAVPIVTKTSMNYTVTETDFTILCSTGSPNRTITIPAASSCSGRIIVVKKIDSGSGQVVIQPSSGTIDGSGNMSLGGLWYTVMLQSDGSNWFVVGTAYVM